LALADRSRAIMSFPESPGDGFELRRGLTLDFGRPGDRDKLLL
jgi:hypothetical protein